MTDTITKDTPLSILEDPPDYSELPEEEFTEMGETIARINEITGWELARWAQEAHERGWSDPEIAEHLNSERRYINDVRRAISKFGEGGSGTQIPISHANQAIRAPDGYENKVLEAAKDENGKATKKRVREAVKATNHIKDYWEDLDAADGYEVEGSVEERIEEDFQREVVGSDKSASQIKNDLKDQKRFRLNDNGKIEKYDEILGGIQDDVIDFINEAPEPLVQGLLTFLEEAQSAAHDRLHSD